MPSFQCTAYWQRFVTLSYSDGKKVFLIHILKDGGSPILQITVNKIGDKCFLNLDNFDDR